MTLRNLNQSFARGRVLGTPKTGVLGSLIPSTGQNGPGYAYPSLNLPADATKEISGYVTTMPSAGALDASEDTAFTFSGATDGLYTFQFQLQEDGVDVGTPRTATLSQGVAGVTISATTGNASAASPNATVTQGGSTTISCGAGNAAAGGATAVILRSLGINCAPGNADAGGPDASITRVTVISCGSGNAVAAGRPATVSSGAGSFCRAPAGPGYHPRRKRISSRPSASQGSTR